MLVLRVKLLVTAIQHVHFGVVEVWVAEGVELAVTATQVLDK